MIKVGIVGCGFVGGALKAWLEENNPEVQIFVSDPPKGYNDDLSQIDVAFLQIHVPTEDDGTQDLTLMKQLNTVESAMGAQEFGHELLSRTTFLQFMIELNRIALKDHTAMVKEAFRSDPKLEEIIAYVNANLEKDLSLESIARQFYMSKSYLMHKFKEMTGYSAHKYIQQKRLIQAAELIRDGVPVVEAGQRCGYGDYSAFLRAFKKLYGVNPSDIG